jgi:hypothetical protein
MCRKMAELRLVRGVLIIERLGRNIEESVCYTGCFLRISASRLDLATASRRLNK